MPCLPCIRATAVRNRTRHTARESHSNALHNIIPALLQSWTRPSALPKQHHDSVVGLHSVISPVCSGTHPPAGTVFLSSLPPVLSARQGEAVSWNISSTVSGLDKYINQQVNQIGTVGSCHQRKPTMTRLSGCTLFKLAICTQKVEILDVTCGPDCWRVLRSWGWQAGCRAYPDSLRLYSGFHRQGAAVVHL